MTIPCTLFVFIQRGQFLGYLSDCHFCKDSTIWAYFKRA